MASIAYLDKIASRNDTARIKSLAIACIVLFFVAAAGWGAFVHAKITGPTIEPARSFFPTKAKRASTFEFGGIQKQLGTIPIGSISVRDDWTWEFDIRGGNWISLKFTPDAPGQGEPVHYQFRGSLSPNGKDRSRGTLLEGGRYRVEAYGDGVWKLRVFQNSGKID